MGLPLKPDFCACTHDIASVDMGYPKWAAWLGFHSTRGCLRGRRTCSWLPLLRANEDVMMADVPHRCDRCQLANRRGAGD